MDRVTWRLVLVYAAAVVLVTTASLVFFYWRASRTTGGATSPPVSTPVPQQASLVNQRAVVKSIGDTTIDYLLYGRIGTVYDEDYQGLYVGFVFDSDPLKRQLPVLIQFQGGGYTLFTYRHNFGETHTTDIVDSSFTLRQVVMNGAPLVELHTQFRRSGLTQDDAALIAALDAAGQNNWGAFSRKAVLVAGSIGVVK